MSALHYLRNVLAPVRPGWLRALWLALFAAALGPAGAAADQGENVLSTSLGYARYTLGDQDESAGGVLVGVEYERGITDALWLRGQIGYGAYPLGEWSHSGDASVGLTYAIDVLKYVPYVKGGIGMLGVAGPAVDASIYPLIEIGAGLDILRSRSMSYGAGARVETLLDGTAFFTIGARISYRWGFF